MFRALEVEGFFLKRGDSGDWFAYLYRYTLVRHEATPHDARGIRLSHPSRSPARGIRLTFVHGSRQLIFPPLL